jgi:Protein of unknown function (DUF4236)
MGFYLRKSVSVGPFRFNLSGAGLGVSVGVPGFRVGSGPRGNYVHLGRAGVYYRHTFSPTASPQPRYSPPMLPIAASHAAMQEIESEGAAMIVDSSSEELLDEIRAKRRKLSLRPFAIVGTVLLLLVAMRAEWPGWALMTAALTGLAIIFAAAYRDRVEKTVVVLYEFEPHVEEAFRRFSEWAQALAASGRTWHVAATGAVFDRKYHAGASNLVQRHPTAIRTAEPPLVKTNVPVVSIAAGRHTLYFLPDRLLVYDRSGVGAISYRSLEIAVSRQRFIEDGGVPHDATVVDHTWKYVNKDGSPDRRFSDNRQIPVCLYDELTLRTSSGLHEVVQVSRSGIGDGFVAAVRHLANVTA